MSGMQIFVTTFDRNFSDEIYRINKGKKPQSKTSHKNHKKHKSKKCNPSRNPPIQKNQ